MAPFFHDFFFFILGVVTYDPQYLPPLEIGRQKEVVLPCDYDIGDSEIGQLDLKWYFNNEVTPFLQWVPGGGRRPQLIEPTPFVGHVDLGSVALLSYFAKCKKIEKCRS